MKIRIATRQSKLALTQTGLVKEALETLGHDVELVPMSTVGDRKQGTAAASAGDKRDWIHDLEVALLEGAAEIAVHSGKDVPAEISSDTVLVPVLPAEDPRDVFIGRETNGARLRFSELTPGLVVGTASLRRRAQLLALRPGVTVAEIRGNVPTRIQKLNDSPELSGIVLAAAGLQRLGMTHLAAETLDELLPAVNQGILTVQYRKGNADLEAAVAKLVHPETEVRFQAERGCVETLQGDCDSAIGVLAAVSGTTFTVRARVLLPDGSHYIEDRLTGDAARAHAIGIELGRKLIAQGAAEILAASRNMA